MNSLVSMPSIDTQKAEHDDWRENRRRELSLPGSWLGLVGLSWLEGEVNSVGSDPRCAVSLAAGPPTHVGDFVQDENGVAWRSAPGVQVEVDGKPVEAGSRASLETDKTGTPSTVTWDNLAFSVIERDGRLAVRVRDLAWRKRIDFTGVDCYPYDPACRIDAAWEALEEPLSLEVQSVTGSMQKVDVAYRALFWRDGTQVALLPLDVREDGVFFIFRDATSGRQTYGGGRFLQTGPVEGERLCLDFNRAFNPPCAFTDFATCSLPPPENWLPFPVEAGEKKYV